MSFVEIDHNTTAPKSDSWLLSMPNFYGPLRTLGTRILAWFSHTELYWPSKAVLWNVLACELFLKKKTVIFKPKVVNEILVFPVLAISKSLQKGGHCVAAHITNSDGTTPLTCIHHFSREDTDNFIFANAMYALWVCLFYFWLFKYVSRQAKCGQLIKFIESGMTVHVLIKCYVLSFHKM